MTIEELQTERDVLLAALTQLVGADNCNYSRDAMRYCGYFAQARAALEAVTGRPWSHPDGELGNGNDPLVVLLQRVLVATPETMKQVCGDIRETIGDETE